MTIYRRPDPVPRANQGDGSAPTLEPIRESSKDLSSLAAQRIFYAITSKAWAQKGLLPREDILGKELGVSRTVVREAVKLLSSKSIVEAKRRRGTVILNQSDWNFVDTDMIDWMNESEHFPDVGDQLIDALTITQGELLAQIARSDLDVRPLAERVRMIDGSPSEAARAALNFHRTVAQIYKNDFVVSLTNSIVHGLQTHHLQRLATGGFGTDVKAYLALLDAVATKDADAVKALHTQIFGPILPADKSNRAPANATS